jgi:hypothetical protein
LKSAAYGFLANPKDVLADLSRRCDRQAFTRYLVAFSLKWGLPVILYGGMFAFLFYPATRFGSTRAGFIAAGTGSLALVLLAVFHLTSASVLSGSNLTEADLTGALSSPKWQTRTLALKTLAERRLDPADYLTDFNMQTSPHIPERLWFARALGSSRKSEAYTTLIQLLDDPHPNVRCMAYYGLGVRGNRDAVHTIIQRINNSHHWYTQWYAYQALRSLKWKQNASN